MARIRTIKPEFWESESVGRLSFGARLLFIASLNFADDEGLLRWNESYLASQAFVYDEQASESISEWMSELVREQVVLPYRTGSTNQRLAWIVSFRTHQVINRPQPSRLPPPSIQNDDFRDAIFRRDGKKCHICKLPISDFGLVNDSDCKLGSLDHVIPVSTGGSDYPSNLRTAHLGCNKRRGNKPLTDSVNDSVAELEGKGIEGELESKGKRKKMPPTPEQQRGFDERDYRKLCTARTELLRTEKSEMGTRLVYSWVGNMTEDAINELAAKQAGIAPWRLAELLERVEPKKAEA